MSEKYERTPIKHSHIAKVIIRIQTPRIKTEAAPAQQSGSAGPRSRYRAKPRFVFSSVGVSAEVCGSFIQDLSALADGLSTLTWCERLPRRRCARVTDMDLKSICDGACTRRARRSLQRSAARSPPDQRPELAASLLRRYAHGTPLGRGKFKAEVLPKGQRERCSVLKASSAPRESCPFTLPTFIPSTGRQSAAFARFPSQTGEQRNERHGQALPAGIRQDPLPVPVLGAGAQHPVLLGDSSCSSD